MNPAGFFLKLISKFPGNHQAVAASLLYGYAYPAKALPQNICPVSRRIHEAFVGDV